MYYMYMYMYIYIYIYIYISSNMFIRKTKLGYEKKSSKNIIEEIIIIYNRTLVST